MDRRRNPVEETKRKPRNNYSSQTISSNQPMNQVEVNNQESPEKLNMREQPSKTFLKVTSEVTSVNFSLRESNSTESHKVFNKQAPEQLINQVGLCQFCSNKFNSSHQSSVEFYRQRRNFNVVSSSFNGLPSNFNKSNGQVEENKKQSHISQSQVLLIFA